MSTKKILYHIIFIFHGTHFSRLKISFIRKKIKDFVEYLKVCHRTLLHEVFASYSVVKLRSGCKIRQYQLYFYLNLSRAIDHYCWLLCQRGLQCNIKVGRQATLQKTVSLFSYYCWCYSCSALRMLNSSLLYTLIHCMICYIQKDIPPYAIRNNNQLRSIFANE